MSDYLSWDGSESLYDRLGGKQSMAGSKWQRHVRMTLSSFEVRDPALQRQTMWSRP